MLHLALSVFLALSTVVSAQDGPPKNVPQGKGAVAVAAPAPGAANEAKGKDDEQPTGNPVPEPATLLLVGTGLVGLALGSRRLRRLRNA